MPCRIELSSIELKLHIGCNETERASAQPVHFRVSVRSDEKFPACWTDALQDTIDVEKMHSLVVDAATPVRVQTLERLGQILEEKFRTQFASVGCEWELTMIKPRFGWTYVHSWST